MGFAADVLNNIISISDFTRGKAGAAFERVRAGAPVIVVRNNTPAAVMVSPEEYDKLAEDSENLYLLELALQRLQASEFGDAIAFNTVMEELGVSQKELDSLPDVELA